MFFLGSGIGLRFQSIFFQSKEIFILLDELAESEKKTVLFEGSAIKSSLQSQLTLWSKGKKVE